MFSVKKKRLRGVAKPFSSPYLVEKMAKNIAAKGIQSIGTYPPRGLKTVEHITIKVEGMNKWD